ncbi:hypothetical protein ACFSSC_07240 [Corynebacterium mendelii]|uniref:Uncharacterized protein n=1 Tax=Corynebacterium mendelii TaxID=2765362 RepID=A0A939E0U0_9CORY|nr:hypothetical protein [Corynebacterium mendelii]MBN9644875.1 hypothetical protein [Corynebacterium mendelii]
MRELAHFSAVPLGHFFLDNPPPVTVPIPDFSDKSLKSTPAKNLRETILLNQRRQEWNFVGAPELKFCGKHPVL